MQVIDIITLALKEIGVLGVGQSALPEDFNDSLLKLNMMISQWNKKRWLIYQLVDVGAVSTGATSYAIGPGQTFDVAARPDKIDSAFIRQLTGTGPSPVDYPLQPIFSMEDYSKIAAKSLLGMTKCFYYDPGYPTGTLHLWPGALAGIYEIHIQVKQLLLTFANLTDEIMLPAEYLEALLYNLALRLAPGYQVEPMQTTVALARAALNTVKNANTQIPELSMPAGLGRTGGYNVYSDQWR